MTYTWNMRLMGDVFVLPGDIVDNHLRLAGSTQLKVLLWCARCGRGEFDAQACSAAIGVSPADCVDALQYWLQTGVLTENGAPASGPAAPPKPAPAPTAPSTPSPAMRVMPPVQARPAAVKPQMNEVVKRQQQSADFAGLLTTVEARLGRPLSHGDMSTLLYLLDTAGLPAGVIMMVVGYAVTVGKANMRYIEKMALDWADREITTVDRAEQEMLRLERRRQAIGHIQALFGLTQSPTFAQVESAYKWVCEWQMPDELIQLAGKQCIERCGKFQFGYVSKILEHWHTDGLKTLDQVKQAGQAGAAKTSKPRKTTSFDLDAYDEMALRYTPVYKSKQ